GIHLIPWQDLGGAPFIYVSDDPRKVPESSPHFRVAIVTLHHVAAGEAAELMNRFAKESVEPAEQGKPAGYFVPEPRTGQLVIRYTSEEQLARYQQMLRLIDVPKKEAQRPVLRTWKARRHFVEELAELFQTEWKKSGGARLSIVPHLETNTLLIRLAPQLWPPVKELLEKLDR
ncbi:MAG: secretin N-terminal domain-containing protein, partial [Planctomycetota bacterium]